MNIIISYLLDKIEEEKADLTRIIDRMERHDKKSLIDQLEESVKIIKAYGIIKHEFNKCSRGI